MLRALTSLVPAVLLVGCVANSGDEGMVVLNNTAPPTTGCLLTGMSSQPFISHGEISTLSPSAYLFTPLIESRLAGTASTTGGTDLQHTIQLQGARVSLEVKGASVQHADGSFSSPTITLSGAAAKFTTLFAGSVTPLGTVNVGMDLIPIPTIASIAQQSGATATDHMHVEVLATATIYGQVGGSDITAQPYQFPVTVCNDCVVVDNGQCPLVITTPRLGDACNPYQDGVVDCCRDASNRLICPGSK